MKKIERIRKKVESDKDIINRFDRWDTVEDFIADAERYISAIKEGRMLVKIGSVSRYGSRRLMKFYECKKNKGRNRYTYLNFINLFHLLGYSIDKDGYIRVGGGGMDMVFHTNHTVIHKLADLGFLTKKQCEKLSQQTPTTI